MPRHDPDRSQRSPAQRTVDDGLDRLFVGQGDDADGCMALANQVDATERIEAVGQAVVYQWEARKRRPGLL